jgi:N-methylhydantoinase B
VWVYLETIGGGSGARATKDGLDGVQVHMTNTSNLPVEALELEYPLTLLRYELVDGSSGPGTHRGGMGIRRVYRAEAECRVSLDTSRLRSAPWGLAGGLPGTGGEFRFSAGTEPFHDGAGLLRAGNVVEIITPGAGGYGPPERRAAELVARDLREGRIGPERAREVHAAAL